MFEGTVSKHNTCLSGIHLAAELFCRKPGEDILKKEVFFFIGQSKEWVTFLG